MPGTLALPIVARCPINLAQPEASGYHASLVRRCFYTSLPVHKLREFEMSTAIPRFMM